jgi:glycosyltransferase involved in cell wall biosynthesis
MEKYPKVLLLCHFSQSRSSGITIRNLFKNWPDSRIAVVEYSDLIESIYVPEISRYYILGQKEVRYLWPFSCFRKPRASTGYVLHTAPPAVKARAPRTGLRAKVQAIVSNLLSGFLRLTGFSFVSRQFRVSPELESWVQAFEPDLIYTSTGDINKLEFAAEIKRHFKTSLALHILDDYVNSSYEETVFPRYWKRRLDSTFRRVLESVDLPLAIGDKMAGEYSEKYGKPFYGFHNPIDPKVWVQDTEEQALTADEASTGEFTFLYAGKVNRDTVEPIIHFMDAVDVLVAQGHAVRLQICSPYPFERIYRLLGERAKSVYHGKVPYADLPATFRNADALLLPLDFSEATIRYIRLSMLTKATEYMISGSPIFIFAPAELAVSEYLMKHDSAFHCGDPVGLEAAILEFMNDPAGRVRIAANAVRCASEDHVIELVGERLRKLIVQSIG